MLQVVSLAVEHAITSKRKSTILKQGKQKGELAKDYTFGSKQFEANSAQT